MTSASRSITSFMRDRKGQNLVEFALVVPLLLLLVIGIAEFGRAWMTKNIMTGATREAARLAAVPIEGGAGGNLWNGVEATARGNRILIAAGIATTVVVQDAASLNGDVIATVTYNFPVVIAGFIPGLSGSTFPLTSTTTMRREY